jgi:hypothetical protein
VLKDIAELADGDWGRSYRFLPAQISFELHGRVLVSRDNATRAGNILRVFQRLLDAGYVPVSRELNLYSAASEEHTWVRLGRACFPERETGADAGAPDGGLAGFAGKLPVPGKRPGSL